MPDDQAPAPRDSTSPSAAGLISDAASDAAESYRNLVSGRSCGDCRVCCRLPDIPELDKPINTWCKHTDLETAGGGCGIYEDRPKTCREYECAWLSGLGDEHDRPDRLGVMYQPITLTDGSPGLAAVEAIDGAFDRPRVRAQLARYSDSKPGQLVMRTAAETRFRPVPLTIGGAKPAVMVEPKPLGAAGLMSAAGRVG